MNSQNLSLNSLCDAIDIDTNQVKTHNFTIGSPDNKGIPNLINGGEGLFKIVEAIECYSESLDAEFDRKCSTASSVSSCNTFTDYTIPTNTSSYYSLIDVKNYKVVSSYQTLQIAAIDHVQRSIGNIRRKEQYVYTSPQISQLSLSSPGKSMNNFGIVGKSIPLNMRNKNTKFRLNRFGFENDKNFHYKQRKNKNVAECEPAEIKISNFHLPPIVQDQLFNIVKREIKFK
ncbi:hypothetical protein ROZALSC1DRAFT_20365 [Rozella allomycis CSF55]|uniref:Uncharacterized protein n=1 Tax=Rozella allomycis (strain CSF55) TaxID=988480 RepID=A0A4V1J0I0_ROZAC|nr:hypothetical protein ROZALSC1DRAFT_20365 [Rozella allomycis CSF55]